MVTTKKKPQTQAPSGFQSIPPEFGGVQSQIPAPGTGRSGTGSLIETKKGLGPDNPDEPDVPGVFGETPTGRPNAVTRGGRTFFIQGSDLELFQQQQDAKDQQNNLSGSTPTGMNPRNTIAENQAIAQQAQQGLPMGAESKMIPGVSPLIFGSVLNGTAQAEILFKKIKKGEKLSSAEKMQIQALGLTQLDLETIRKGEVDINGLSRLIEGLPILRKLKTPGGEGIPKLSVADFTGTSPSTKIDELLKALKDNNEDLGEELNAINTDPIRAGFHQQAAEQHKNEIIKLESRIKLLGILSPEVQGNPDRANEITGEITRVKRNYPQLNWSN